MRPVRTFLFATTLAAASATAALAQGGGFNPSAFAKFREQHKYTFQLLTTTSRGFTECERSQASRIKPDQAKKILGLLNPLKKQPTLTQDDAKATIMKLQRVLDAKQLTAVDKAIKEAAQRRGGGGAPGGAPGGGAPGGGAPGGGAPGGGAPGGGRPGGASTFDPAKAKNFNPFNPQPGSPRYEVRKVSNGKLFAFLEARAAGKDAKLDLPLPGGPRPGGAPGAPGGAGAGNPR